MIDHRQPTKSKHQLSYSSASGNPAFNQQTHPHSYHFEKAPFNRQDSDISLYGQESAFFESIDPDAKADSNSPRWTRKQWEALERWYVKGNRDCQQATEAFFIYESVISKSEPPLWSKECILWHCRCLDTNTKYHYGILPSERKRLKDKLKNMAKQHDLLRPKRGIEEQQQQQQRRQRQRH